MYGKAYQAETILRKKKSRPFAKEIIKEVSEGEDLFNALFSRNIKDVKQKVKQDQTRSRKNKISQKPIFAGIPEHPVCESVDSSDFLDPFDALLKDTRGHIEKNKVNICDSPSKSGVKIHENEKENSPEGGNCLVLDHKKKTPVFESVLQGATKKFSEKPHSATLKRRHLKLKRERKGSKIKEKTNSFLNLIDSSCDLDALEDDLQSGSKSSLKSALEGENLCEDICSGNESNAICSHSSSPNLCCYRERSTVNFRSSTPAKHVSLTKPSTKIQNKHEQKRESNGSEYSDQLSTLPTQEELPCLLSPILSVTEQRHSKTNHVQKNANICSFMRLRLSSEENENKMDMKYWKKMYRKHNPVPIAVEKVTVQPFIHANYEDSGTEDNSDPDKSVKNFSDKKENICSLPQSPDPFADEDLQDPFQTSTECVVKSETRLEEVHEQSSSTCEQTSKYCHCIENKVIQEPVKCDREKSLSDSINKETNVFKNSVSSIEDNVIGHMDSQISLKENCADLQDLTYSPSMKNVCFRRSYASKSSKLEEKRNSFSAIDDSKHLLNSETADSVMTSNCSAILTKFDTSERIPDFIDTSSQAKISLSESRSSYKAMKKKSFAQRRSHLVVPLAQNVGQIYERISGFREVYISTPLQRRRIDKNLSHCHQVASPDNVLKYDDDDDADEDDDLDEEKKDGITFKDVVLEHCGQSDVLAFDEAFPESDLTDCMKIGEGVYGEVFARLNSHQQQTVMKIMPIEGDCLINGESQKSFEEILPEIVVTVQLSKLRENEDFSTPNFPELIDCWCVQGKYPPRLLKLWQEYDEQKTSENDSPEILPDDQIFIILELSNVGSALEGFVFNSAEQSWSAFMQVTYTLAVAEASLEFEHRDLHWGNILIKRTTDKTIRCKMYGEDHVVPAQGIQASVIDFTLSRITYDGCCIYNNLAEDPTLFEGEGDYQFDIYRMMRDKTENNWQVFQPYNNVLWLSYVLEKLVTEVYYRNEKTKIHKRGIGKLKEMRSRILDFKRFFFNIEKTNLSSKLVTKGSKKKSFERVMKVKF
ncbi:Putative serine/threonine-protein kinase haspin homolog-like Protein [Gryllus bimaculatus]|nr:Putative serine/threonine-protein kinase haspin homolog-like Protein [Gryllus bimaculatus]